ncbi:MAG: thiolase domain-containing protein, partial [Pseudomonadota bacterium]
MAKTDVFVLGGAQTDFAVNYDRNGKEIFDLFREVTEAALAATNVEPGEIETAHVGNFVGELFTGQGQ